MIGSGRVVGRVVSTRPRGVSVISTPDMTSASVRTFIQLSVIVIGDVECEE